MADVRCANPAYQLDVDVMILEYTLYYAIDAKLKALKLRAINDEADERRVDGGDGGVPVWCDREKEQDLHAGATRLIESFDVLIRLFRHNHPTYTLSEGVNFNIKVLELLVLIGQWLEHELAVSQIKEERLFNSQYRRQWLKVWAADPRPHLLFKERISGKPNPQPEFETDQIEFNDCLIRFMDVSAEIGDAMGCVNEQWYHLASRFMLQSAIERLRFVPDSSEFEGDRSAEVLTHILECCAWGLIQPHPFMVPPVRVDELNDWPAQRVGDQIHISNIFRKQIDGEDNYVESKSASGAIGSRDSEMLNMSIANPTEDSTWTTLRSDCMTDIFNHISAFIETGLAPPFSAVTKEFRYWSPLPDFLGKVYNFLEDAWCLNMETITEKPVLVQIEEGGLKGCNDQEFRQLLDRVGLKISGRGVVKWVR